MAREGGMRMPITGIQLQPGFEKTTPSNLQGTDNIPDAREVMRRKMQEMYDKVESGDTGQSFQIGRESYTQDEWDKMLSKVDRAINEIKEEDRKEQEKREALEDAKSAGTDTESEITEDQIAELLRDRG